MEKKIEIPFGENKIVAEIYDADCPEFPPEIYVCMKDKDNVMIQDICLVRPHYTIGDKCEAIINNNFVQCIVYYGPEIEAYTEKHVIEIHKTEDDQ